VTTMTMTITPVPTRRTTWRITSATTGRVLRQLSHDRRTLGMILGVPVLLIALLYFMFQQTPGVFDHVGPVLVGLFPFVIMFLLTSIAMLRERRSGTFERLMTTPARPVDLIAGYSVAFGAAAAVQALIVVGMTYGVFGVSARTGVAPVILTAILTALLGVGLGLLCSAFSRTEFQAVQMLPVIVIPQLLLCGLFVARADMPGWLQVISDVLPLSYAVDAVQQAGLHDTLTGQLWRDLAVVAGCVILTLGLATASLRRRAG